MKRFKSFKLLSVSLLLTSLITACGGGGGDNGKSSGGGGAGFTVHGTVIFDQSDQVINIDRYGISSYNIDDESTTILTNGIRPHTHTNTDKIVYLQQCHDDGLFEYYRAAYIDSQGLITPITVCSTEILNPTTGIQIWEDLTNFDNVAISPDETKIAVSISYDRLNDTQNGIVGTDYDILVFDLSGNVLATIENGFSANWLPDGRLLYAYGYHFYTTDDTFQTSTQIEDNGKINDFVANPAIHPEGTFFLFEYNQGIWRMNIDGSGLENVLQKNRRLRRPSWNPDGTQFVFTQWDQSTNSAEERLWFYDLHTQNDGFLDIKGLQLLGEPWGPLSWIRQGN